MPIALNEVNVYITKGNNYLSNEKKELKIKVDSTDNIVTFSSRYNDFRVTLVRNKETNEWEIRK